MRFWGAEVLDELAVRGLEDEQAGGDQRHS
jgi:hypothetical protein